MQHSVELTPAFLKLEKRLEEVHRGEWVFASREVQNKYCNIQPISLCKFKADDDYVHYKGETNNRYLNIKTFVNYVSMSIGESEYEADSYIDVVGAINIDRNIRHGEIIYHLGWDKWSIDYYDLN